MQITPNTPCKRIKYPCNDHNLKSITGLTKLKNKTIQLISRFFHREKQSNKSPKNTVHHLSADKCPSQQHQTQNHQHIKPKFESTNLNISPCNKGSYNHIEDCFTNHTASSIMRNIPEYHPLFVMPNLPNQNLSCDRKDNNNNNRSYWPNSRDCSQSNPQQFHRIISNNNDIRRNSSANGFLLHRRDKNQIQYLTLPVNAPKYYDLSQTRRISHHKCPSDQRIQTLPSKKCTSQNNIYPNQISLPVKQIHLRNKTILTSTNNQKQLPKSSSSLSYSQTTKSCEKARNRLNRSRTKTCPSFDNLSLHQLRSSPCPVGTRITPSAKQTKTSSQSQFILPQPQSSNGCSIPSSQKYNNTANQNPHQQLGKLSGYNWSFGDYSRTTTGSNSMELVKAY